MADQVCLAKSYTTIAMELARDSGYGKHFWGSLIRLNLSVTVLA